MARTRHSAPQLAAPSPAETRASDIRILHVEDNAADAELIARRLRGDGLSFTCRVVGDEPSLRRALADFAADVVLSDFSLGAFDGLAALAIARQAASSIPFIFVSGTIGEERAIEALKRGATDYVLKDNLRRLAPAITSALRQARLAAAKDLAEDLLRRSQSRLQDIVNTSRDWIWECDRAGRFTFSSPSVADVLGYTHEEILGHAAAEYVDPADELQLQATLADVQLDDKAVTLRWRHKTGKVRWLERRLVPLRDADGAWGGVRGIDRDVTLRVAQEVRIRRLNRALRFLSGASAAGMRIRDRDQLVREACRLAVRVGGYERATLYLLPSDGSPPKPVVHSYATTDDGAKWNVSDQLPVGINAVTQALATAEPVVINDTAADSALALLTQRRDPRVDLGSRIALPLVVERKVIGILELRASEPNVFGEAELALLKQVAANITFALQYLRSRQNAEYLEYFDPLTGLANRTLYLTRVAGALDTTLRNGSRLAIGVIDIADLGSVNDNLGHHAGDLVLQLVGERLRAVCRDSNAVCRLSGDRFALMCPNMDDDALDALRARADAAFELPFSVHGRDLHVAMRAGVALSPEDGKDPETLLQAAHMALQHAKHTGVRCTRYVASMNETTSQRFNMVNDLRRAVADKSFTLSYQPKLDLITGTIGGVEALIRWPGASEPVSPNVFVPLLESLGLIDEVGEWVIDRALAESGRWLPQSGFRVAVNVSPLQLNRDDFADHVLAQLRELGCDPHRLEIEVTESTLMADPRRANRSLARLRESGVSIAIDDFGTGHSSLRILAGLPIDVLKIDRSFVRNLTTNRNDRLIVQTTIGLAKSLRLKTVAEGVETEEQLLALRALGCDYVQGYWLSEPMSATEMDRWLGGRALELAKSVAAMPDAGALLAARNA